MMVAAKSFKKGDKQAKRNSFSTPELVLKVLFKAKKRRLFALFHHFVPQDRGFADVGISRNHTGVGSKTPSSEIPDPALVRKRLVMFSKRSLHVQRVAHTPCDGISFVC